MLPRNPGAPTGRADDHLRCSPPAQCQGRAPHECGNPLDESGQQGGRQGDACINDGPEREGGKVERLRAEIVDLRHRIVRLERGRPKSRQPDCRDPLPVASTAFTCGALTMFVIMVLLS